MTLDLITLALRAAQTPIQRYLWTPKDMITFTPRVLGETFGDGRALFALTTINCRPAFWIVRGCSTWTTSDYDAPDDAPNFIEHVDSIVEAIEGQFGSVRNYERNARGDWIEEETKRFVPRKWTEYPVMDDENGCSWDRLDWPALDGVTFTPHPFASRFKILA
jgi:hypothetical protein